MKILGKATVSYAKVEAWIKGVKYASPLALKLLPIFWREAEGRGIDPCVLFAQAMLETGYLQFGGVIDATFHNTCGLKTTKGGGDYAANAHMRFASWEEGIKAHADHLALYAGAKGFPRYSPNTKGYSNEKYKTNGTTNDPRHYTYLYGKCPTVEGLSGTWATNKKYAQDIKAIIEKMKNTKVNNMTQVVQEQTKKEENKKVKYANGSYNRKAKVTASSLNVRRGRPGTTGYSTIIGSYKKGQIISVHYCLNGWFGVTYKGKQCFICGDYVELI